MEFPNCVMSFVVLQLLMEACSAGLTTLSHCRPGDPTPRQPTLHCSQCAGQCGHVKNLSKRRSCSCDPACVAYADCCVDFEQSCPTQFSASGPLRDHFRFQRTDCYAVRTLAASTTGGAVDFNFVSICGRTGVHCNRTADPSHLLRPNLAIPIVDAGTGIHYVNYDCARCNGVTDVILWAPQFNCATPRAPSKEYINGTVRTSTTICTEEDLRRYLADAECEVNYIIPSAFPARGGVVRRNCPSSCKNAQLVNLCEHSYTADTMFNADGTQYTNYYCAVCAGETSLRCESPQEIPRIESTRSFPGQGFSLSLLFDFNPSEGVTVGRKACLHNQKWDGGSRECHQIACVEDQRLVNGVCLPRSTQIKLVSSLHFNKTQDLKAVHHLVGDNLMRKPLTIQIKTLLSNREAIGLKLNSIIVADYMLNVTLVVDITGNSKSTFNFSTSAVRTLSDNISRIFEEELIITVQQADVNLGKVVLTVEENTVLNEAFFVDCTWLLFAEEDFELMKDTLIIKSTLKKYPMGRFRLLKTEALVCISNKPVTRVQLDVKDELGILTIVLLSLSILCLFIRLLLQACISYYWSFAGWLQFNLCLSLCMAYTMLLFGGVVALYDLRQLCGIIAVAIYWLFLTSFSWMAAATIDTWLVLRPAASFIKVDDKDKSLTRYTVTCWLCPALAAGTVMALDATNIDKRFRPDFGVNICHFNQRYAMLVYFGLPVGILVFISAAFFILTVVYLRRTMRSILKPSSSDKASHHVWIYFRLFSLMGVSWVTGFVASFIGHDVLWGIFIVLNASQGIFIFISFVLHHQVVNEIQQWCGQHLEQQGTPRTSSTGMSSGGTQQEVAVTLSPAP